MKKNMATGRKLQAKKTKHRIFHSALSLIDDHGYDNVTIEDISTKAGVSVGAFYHYFNSKSDILVELYALIDHYYAETVTPLLVHADAFDNIRLFLENYASYQIKRGLDHVRLLMGTQTMLFVDKSRYMYALFYGVIEQGQKDGQISKDFTADFIQDYYFVLTRGVLLDWSLCNGSYDLKDRLLTYVDMIKPIFAA